VDESRAVDCFKFSAVPKARAQRFQHNAFDLTRKHHVLIDCLESLQELIAGPHSPTFHPEEPFQVFFPGNAGPIKCQISGTFNQPIIGDDPSVYLTLWPAGNDAFIDYGLQLLKVGHADQSFYLRQLVRAVGAGHGAVQRELKHLTNMGLIVRRPQGNQVLYRANPQSPIFREIKSLITKTVGIHDGFSHI